MRVRVTQGALYLALKHVAAAVAAKPLLSVLSGIRLHAGGDGLVLTAANEVSRLQYQIPAEDPALAILEPGEAVVPALRFTGLIRYLEDGMVTLETDGKGTLQIDSSGTVCKLILAAPASDFPPDIRPADCAELRIPNRELKRMVKQVGFAADSSEARMVLTGILCRIVGRRICLTATDGIRLAFSSGELESSPANDFPPGVVPAKPITDYVRKLADSGTTNITMGRGTIELESERFSIQSSLLAGAYPYVDGLKPEASPYCVRVAAPSLLRAVERAALLSGDRHVVTMRVGLEGIELSAVCAQAGGVLEVLPCGENGAGCSVLPFAVSFDSRYLREILLYIGSGKVQLSFTAPDRPMVVEPADRGQEAQAYYYLLTPVRTAQSLPDTGASAIKSSV
ncbi:DNA polymerase III subunit beta [Paenibacillus sp. S-38]|uniref:DNA polymerase III subunit beta n=1 Tax=Paenibacillus sp. S-38 TaxID=3416710 RepID=UPI003CE97E48